MPELSGLSGFGPVTLTTIYQFCVGKEQEQTKSDKSEIVLTSTLCLNDARCFFMVCRRNLFNCLQTVQMKNYAHEQIEI